jgi:hypothetical protein
MLQLYAAPPADSPEDHPGAFHRSIFVFVSPSAIGVAQPGGVRVFRGQLPRDNPFYGSVPSDEPLPPQLPPADQQLSLERDAWAVVHHERNPKDGHQVNKSPPLFREWAMVVEPEEGSWRVRCQLNSFPTLTWMLQSRHADANLLESLKQRHVQDDASTSAEDRSDSHTSARPSSNAAPRSALAVNRESGAAQASRDPSGLVASDIQDRIRKYKEMVAAEGEMGASEAQQVDEAFQDQVSQDDQVWAVCCNPGAVVTASGLSYEMRAERHVAPLFVSVCTLCKHQQPACCSSHIFRVHACSTSKLSPQQVLARCSDTTSMPAQSPCWAVHFQLPVQSRLVHDAALLVDTSSRSCHRCSRSLMLTMHLMTPQIGAQALCLPVSIPS